MTASQPLEADVPLLRTLIDLIPARIAIIDIDLRYICANREFLESIGRAGHDVIGQPAVEARGERSADDFTALTERVRSGETCRWLEWDAKRAHQPRRTEKILAPYKTSMGDLGGFFLLTRDLPDLSETERELADQRAELDVSQALNAAFTASALDCVITIDEAGNVLDFNPVAERTMGYRRADTIGRPISELIIPPVHRERHKQGMQRYLSTGNSTVLGRRVEIEAMRADGSIFPVELAITDVRLPTQRIFTAYLRDLTETKRAALEIERQREALHQAEKLSALGSLLAGVAHELNNPLSIVIGQSLMLSAKLYEATSLNDLKSAAIRATKINHAADRCARIVRTFLAMARKSPAKRGQVKLGQIVEAAIELLDYSLRTADIEVISTLPEDLPEIAGDVDQLHQIVLNLLINSRQVLEDMPSPRVIEISARVEGGMVITSFGDNGPGVPEDLRGRIFDPFFTTKPMGSGTGIGLSMSRGFAESHGGSLALVDSAQGALFELKLPVAAAPVIQLTELLPELGSLVRQRALVIDDEAEVAELLGEILEKRGLEVRLALSGHAAQDILVEDEHFHLVFCDLGMPDLDGQGLYRWIETHHPKLTERIVFVTGDMLGAGTGRFLAECDRPVVEKPFSIREIERIATEVIATSSPD